MRQHPIYANNLDSKIPYLLPALDIPYFHHERGMVPVTPRDCWGHNRIKHYTAYYNLAWKTVMVYGRL